MSRENNSQIRIPWIDTLRTISIFFIVLIHTGRNSSIVSIYTTSFFMPVFFFISGLFIKKSIKEQKFISFFKIKFQHLIIPYLTFSIVSYLIWFFLIGKLKGDSLPNNPLWDFIINTLYGVAGYGWMKYNISLWFFPCLFITELIFFFLIRLSPKKLPLTVFILSIIGYYYFEFIKIEHFRLPFSIDVAITAVVFYTIGYLIKPYIFNEEFKTWYNFPSLFFGLLTYLIFSMFNETSAFVIGNFGKNYLYFYLAALSGIFFWCQISKIIKPHQIFAEIGKNTIVIFPLHLLLFPFFTGIAVYILKIPKELIDQSDIVALIYALFAIFILVPVSWFLNRYIPFIIGKNIR
ncbi:acyltransferase family protein [Geminocystis sp. GBBB08]|uniref:acyltransferase family protein n=1 Tax=Geminocystis sp. GBBB08 TaxID=2604140 RepID=UPI0027E38BF7|nr:acyltransferase family protein [Geminocystis sp. GBBB08]MBL1210768.1 acyltransferase family protein [Geminocystis sp. GBBB08]